MCILLNLVDCIGQNITLSHNTSIHVSSIQKQNKKKIDKQVNRSFNPTEITKTCYDYKI